MEIPAIAPAERILWFEYGVVVDVGVGIVDGMAIMSGGSLLSNTHWEMLKVRLLYSAVRYVS